MILQIICMILFVHGGFSYPENGKWDFETFGSESTIEQAMVVTKSIFKGGKIEVGIICKPSPAHEEFKIAVTWYLRKAACWKEYYESGPANISAKYIFDQVNYLTAQVNRTSSFDTVEEIHLCDGSSFSLTPTKGELTAKSDADAKAKQQSKMPVAPIQNDKLKDPLYTGIDKREAKVAKQSSSASHPGLADLPPFYTVAADGIYQFILSTKIYGGTQKGNVSFKANVHIEIFDTYGYLSAADYPLLVFYATMCVIYFLYGLAWLTVSFLRWRELLRVQYWIGAVILLGMLEKAAFTAEYEHVNKHGDSLSSLVVFAELVSCAKRTLSRMLLIIVAFGFGIVKPRLGVVLHRVVAVGTLYFVLSSIEGCMRALKTKLPNIEESRRLLFSVVPLALLESAICWWVFSALVQTTRTLKLRRNYVKLSLFKHLMNTLAFAVIMSVIFMLWSIKYQNLDICVGDWKQLWVNDAFWHVLFALILLVIMVLWRPTNNNQRFAFSPLLDDGSECSEDGSEGEHLMADVSDSMHLRNHKTSTADIPRENHNLDDDMKWLDENIPQTDTGLPTLDSDEEILTTRFEISKMQ